MRFVPLCLITAFSLAGCSYAAAEPANSASEPKAKPVQHHCEAEPVQRHVGHKASQPMGAAILRESGAHTLRWGPPDSSWTMDYREDRVNVRYDRAMTITAITCG